MKKSHWARPALGACAAAVALAAPTEATALDWFLKVDGITGEVQDKQHKGEIQIESFSWGARQQGSGMTGSARGAARGCMTEISFTKRADSASPVLLVKAVSGSPIGQAVLVGRKSGEVQQEFLKIELKNILVSSVSHAGNTEDVQEAFDFKFQSAVVTFTPQDENGKPGKAITSTLNPSAGCN